MKNRFLILSFALTCICAMSVARATSYEKRDVSKTQLVPGQDMSIIADVTAEIPSMEIQAPALSSMSETVKAIHSTTVKSFDEPFDLYGHKRWYSTGLVYNRTENHLSYLKSDYPIKQCMYRADV